MTNDLFDGPDADENGELPKDQWGRYKLPHPITGVIAGRTRATTFAKSVADTYVLSQWQMRMALKGMTLRPDLYALIAATPLDDRDRLNQLAEDCKEAASARAAANLGTAFHAFAEETDRNGQIPPHMPPNLQPLLAARQAALAEHRVSIVTDMIERTVFVPTFDVCGTLDRWGYVGAVSGAGEILDDKTGRDLTYGWNEIVIQLALYANASHVLNREVFWRDYRTAIASGVPNKMNPRCWELMPMTRTDRAIVVHAPVKAALDAPNEPPVVTLYEVDIKAGWEAASLCHQVRQWRKRRKLAVPLTVTGTGWTVRKSALVESAKSELADTINESLSKAADQANLGLDGIKDTMTPDALRQLANERHPGLVDMVTREPTWEEKLRGCSSLAELSAVWRAATAKGEWSVDLEKIGKDQMSKFHTL